jgi:hypothetical protein
VLADKYQLESAGTLFQFRHYRGDKNAAYTFRTSMIVVTVSKDAFLPIDWLLVMGTNFLNLYENRTTLENIL